MDYELSARIQEVGNFDVEEEKKMGAGCTDTRMRQYRRLHDTVYTAQIWEHGTPLRLTRHEISRNQSLGHGWLNGNYVFITC